MVVNKITVDLLNTTLASPESRQLFRRIAARRIEEVSSLQKDFPETEENPSALTGKLDALKDDDLIGFGSSKDKLYVTAKGLKVARDLKELSVM